MEPKIIGGNFGVKRLVGRITFGHEFLGWGDPASLRLDVRELNSINNLPADFAKNFSKASLPVLVIAISVVDAPIY